MFSKILLCADGSEPALNAAYAAAEIARQFGSHVALVSVFDPPVITNPYIGFTEAPLLTAIDGDCFAEETHRAIERDTGKILEDSVIAYTCRRELGHPVDRIVSTAQDMQTDLIILGSRGLRGFERLLLGSVSEGVLRHAHCPVLIVRSNHALPQAPQWQRVLLASDGSEGAAQATAAALEIAQKFAASLSILNVLDATSLCYRLSPYVPTGDDDPRILAEHLLAKVTKDVNMDANHAGVPRSFHQETGNPAETIVSYANRNDASLIVVGCRGMGTFESLLLGSVSNHVAHYSRCSVLVTR